MQSTQPSIRFSLLILIFSTYLLTPFDARACNCIEIKSFCDHISAGMDVDPDHLVVARGFFTRTITVNDHRRDLVFKISESLYNPQGLEILRIRDGQSVDCTLNLDAYDVGQEVVLITLANGERGDFPQLSICTPAPLIITEGRITGQITSSHFESMSIHMFRKLDCIPSSSHISLFPNPVRDFLQILAPDLTETSEVKIFILDALGNRVYQYEPDAEEKLQTEWELNVRDWAQGTYYLSIVGDRFPPSLTPFVVMH